MAERLPGCDLPTLLMRADLAMYEAEVRSQVPNVPVDSPSPGELRVD
jgi:hypothetical protein